MPSNKDPVTTVQPGPGHLPDGTVSANALDFNPGVGSLTALQAHITNPTGAHADSAISTGGFGIGPRTVAPGNVETTLTSVYADLNSEATWVLDANPASRADFVGPNALINALASAFFVGKKFQIYLRPGVYNWTDASILSDCTIIGGGSFNNASSRVEVRNLAGAMRFGAGNTILNVFIHLSGKLQIGVGGVGNNTFENVALDVVGDVEVLGSTNKFTHFVNATSSSTPLYIHESSGSNLFTKLVASQLLFDGPGGNILTDVLIGAGTNQKYPGNTTVKIDSNDNIVTKLLVNTVGSSGGLTIEVVGSSCTFSGVKVQGTTDVGGALLVFGSNNNLSGVSISSATSLFPLVNVITGSGNVLTSLNLSSCTTSGSPAIQVQSDHNKLDAIVVSSIIGAESILSVSGTNNDIGTLTISSITSALVTGYVLFSGDGNTLGNLRISNTTVTGLVLWLAGGSANRVTSMVLDTMINMASPLIQITGGGSSCVVENVLARAISATPGAGLQLVTMSNAIGCVVRNMSLTSSPVFGTTSQLVSLDGCLNCSVDGLDLANVGFTDNLAAPIVKSGGSAVSTNSVLKNFSFSSVFVANSILLFDIEQTWWAGLTLDNVSCPVNVTGGTHLKMYSLSPAWNQQYTYRVQGCTFVNGAATAGHTVWVSSCGIPVDMKNSYMQCSDTASFALRVEDSVSFSASDCEASGPGAGSLITSGSSLTRCKFLGISGASNGTQLFQGYGRVADTVFPGAPLKITDCELLVGTSNIKTTATTSPVVFLGGAGTTAPVNHGSVVVSGLTIKPIPSSGITNWHKSSILAVDTANQAISSDVSSFSRITIDLEAIGWNSSGLGSSVFSVSNTRSAVLEVNGQGSYPPSFKGISILRVSRNGGTGDRHIAKMFGCIADDLLIDGVSGGSSANYLAETVFFNTVVSHNLTLFPFSGGGSLPTGTGFFIIRASASTLDRCRIQRIHSGAQETQGLITANGTYITRGNWDTQGQTFTNMLILANGGIKDTICAVSDITGPFILLNGNAYIEDCGLTFNHSATSNVDNTVAVQATTQCVIKHNRFTNGAGTVSGAYPTLGGGCLINVTGDNTIVDGNILTYSAAWGVDVLPSIQYSAVFGSVINNVTMNQATSAFNVGGTNSIRISGHYCNITGNKVIGTNTVAFKVVIDSSAGHHNTLSNNHVENTDGAASGEMIEDATDLPAPYASFNQLT